MTARLPLKIVPIGNDAWDGRFQLVRDSGGRFALVRWNGARWVFSSGIPLDFEPTHYIPSSAP